MMKHKAGAERVTEYKDLIEWLLAPIAAFMLWLGKVLHGHTRWLGKHETAIALLVNDQQAEQEKRSEQRQEMIEVMKKTDGKIDMLTDKFNTLLVELAAKR